MTASQSNTARFERVLTDFGNDSKDAAEIALVGSEYFAQKREEMKRQRELNS
ncbi:hypothetical protein AHIS1_p083 [Acaryochloris phage A-HIS1]|nr:hypothetical protein AHIS1_p083 [Acaryochloris phage A-HIS1]